MSLRRASSAFAATALAIASSCARSAERTAVPEDEIWVQPAQLAGGEARVVEVREELLPEPVAAPGRVALDDQRVQHVLSPVAGQVTRVHVQLGDRVRRGSPLVAMLSPEVGSAVSDLVKGQADFAQAAAEFARQQRLTAAEAAPRHDLEVAQDAQGKAEAELARAMQKARLLGSGGVDAVTQEFVLRSAIDGEVLVRGVNPGMQVQGTYSGGTPAELFTIGDIDRVWVLADVPEPDVARLRLGAAASVRVAAWPGRTFSGQVSWIASTLDPALRTARVRVVLPNVDRALEPEMLAQVSIAASAVRVLILPRDAIVPVEGEAFAYVAAGQAADGRLRFVRRRLHVAESARSDVLSIRSGVGAGDRVLLEGVAHAEARGGEVKLTRGQFDKAGLRLEAVREQDIGDTLTASARVAFDDAHVTHVFSPVTGRIARVLAQPGDLVKRGAPLLAISSPDVGTAFADFAKAQAELVAAEHDLARQRELVLAHAGARKDLELAEATWRKAQAEVDRARQKTRLLASGAWDAVTQEYTLRSPIAGEVVSRAATPGLEVQGQWGGGGSPVELFTIGAIDPLWILGDVYEIDLPHVRKGLPVVVRSPASPGHAFSGRIDWVASVIDPLTRTAKVRCAIENPGRLLRPDMAPVLSIALPTHRHLGVPRDAILRLGDETVVFVAAGEAREGLLRFQRRKVTIGEDGATGIVPVLEGLTAGEQVVASGGIFLVGLL